MKTRRRRRKNITFQAEVEEVESDDEKDLTEPIARLSKNFNKVMKMFNKKNRNTSYGSSSNFQKTKAATSGTNFKTKN